MKNAPSVISVQAVTHQKKKYNDDSFRENVFTNLLPPI